MKKQLLLKTEVTKNNTVKQISYMLMIVVAVLFFNTLNHDYNLDDDLVTLNHPLTSKGLSSVGEIFTSSYFVDNMGHAYGYRPVVLFSFALEHQIFGENPSVSHLINLLLYMILVVSFFRLLNRFFGVEKVMLSALIALIFAVHPIHSEVVASIKNRDEILALLFAVWSAISMLRYISTKQRKHLFFVILLFTIGILSKKSIFPLAFVFPVFAVFFNKISFKEYLSLSLAFLIPAALVGSELNLMRLLMIFSLGVSLLYAVYLFKKVGQHEKNETDRAEAEFSKVQILINLVLIGMIACVATILNSPLLLLGLFPFLFVRYNHSDDFFFAPFAFSLLLVSKLLGNPVSETIAFVLLIWSFVKMPDFFRFMKVFQWSLLAAGCLIFNFYPQFEFGNLVLTLLTFTFFLLLQIRLIFAVLIYLVILSSILFTGSILFPIILTIFLAFHLLRNGTKIRSLMWLEKMSMGVTIILVSFGSYYELKEKKSINHSTYLSQWEQNNENAMKEGRPLTYIENSLVQDAGTEQIVATGMQTIGYYLRLMIAPVNLAFYYGYAHTKTIDFLNAGFWVSLLAYLALFWLAWIKRNDRPEITLGIIWFTFCILLFSNWFELIAGMVGERLAFSASAGFSLFLGSMVIWWRPSFSLFNPKSKDWIVIAILVIFFALSFRRNSLWKDRITLISNDIEYLSSSAQAHNLFGLALMTTANSQYSKTDEQAFQMKKRALYQFNRATEIYPKFFNAQYDKGRVLVELGEFKSARIEFKKAYELDTMSVIALEGIIKSAFEAKLHNEVITYSQIYFERFQPNELIFELVAYSCLLNRDFERCEQIALKANRLFPENTNFVRMITDSRNKLIL